MATAKKATAKKAPAKKATTKAAKTTAKTTAKTAPKAAAKPAAAAPLKPVITGPLKPIKTAFNKTSLVAHLASTAAVDPKAVKAVIAALEATIAASVAKKGAGAFTLPGLFKVTSVHVPAKKARMGIDPFTKQERKFAAKPATTKVKVRAMKKLKDAALA
ncbi:MAG: HU family DNA-binding protein [Piscinibacter sp.]|nr:HU family DNA-binding protein [Piscinibacter sp.]